MDERCAAKILNKGANLLSGYKNIHAGKVKPDQ